MDLIKTDPGRFSKTISGDESWIYGNEPKQKHNLHSKKTHQEQQLKKAIQSQSHLKPVLSFFDQDSIVYHKYAPKGQTVNNELYLEVLRRLQDAAQKKQHKLWASRD